MGFQILLAFAISIRSAKAFPEIDPTSFWNSGFYDTCAITNCFVPITIGYPCETNDNDCVCSTSGFVSQVAACLGQKCSGIVYSTYSRYNVNCASSGLSLPLSMTQFLNLSGTLESWLETNFWYQYPACANTNCLSPLTAESGCDISTNRCVCLNGNLQTAMAGCIENACSTSTVSEVYNLYQAACAMNGGYIIALDSAQWETAAGSGSGSGSGSGGGSSSSSLPGTSTSSQIAPGGPLRTVSASGTYILPSTSLATSTYSSTSSASGTYSLPSSTGLATSTYSSTSSASGTYSLPSTSLATSTYSSTSSLTSQASTPMSTASSGKGYTEDQKISLGVGLAIGLAGIILTALGLYYNISVKRRGGEGADSVYIQH